MESTCCVAWVEIIRIYIVKIFCRANQFMEVLNIFVIHQKCNGKMSCLHTPGKLCVLFWCAPQTALVTENVVMVIQLYTFLLNPIFHIFLSNLFCHLIEVFSVCCTLDLSCSLYWCTCSYLTIYTVERRQKSLHNTDSNLDILQLLGITLCLK